MKVAAIQHDITWLNRVENFSHLRPLIAEAANNGARLIVLSEMFSTGFAMGAEWANDLPEKFGGPSSSFLCEVAQEHGVWVAGSCPELPENAAVGALPRNTLIVASPSGELHRYCKVHPFSFGGEDKWFAPGASNVTVTIENVRVSLFVCYDLRFADHFWRLAPQTDLYLVPANWPSVRRQHWITLLDARAIENQAFVMGVNRVGTGGSLVYGGDSRIVGPFGEVLAQADAEETIIYADVDPQIVADVRSTYPFLKDR